MGKNIKFIAQNDHVWNVRPRPFPAAKGLPQWWKDMPSYSGTNGFDIQPYSTVTVKKCVPTLDILASGYYVPLWSDLLVKQESEGPVIKWTVNNPVLETWGSAQVDSFNIPKNYSKTIFKNLHGWVIKTPPGWSCMFLHPVAYLDSPFQTISGIVDTDIFNGEINVPFVIKKDFEGIIERDTPMFQVIPFKRENWTSEFEIKNKDEHFFDSEKFYSKIYRPYKSIIKNDKKYR